MKHLRLAITTACIGGLIATAVPIQAATTFAPYSVALSPQENRQIQAQNAALARELGLTVTLVDAVARELSLKTPKSQFSYGRFLSDIRAQARKSSLCDPKSINLKTLLCARPPCWHSKLHNAPLTKAAWQMPKPHSASSPFCVRRNRLKD